jgi:adenine-specific DNA-methyltransferase
MNYIGSKRRLLPTLIARAFARGDRRRPGRFGDAFAGTHAVGRYAQAVQGHIVYANDWQYFSAILGDAHLQTVVPKFPNVLLGHKTDAESMQQWIAHLNELIAQELPIHRAGWFAEALGEGVWGQRLYFSRENAYAIEIVREAILRFARPPLSLPPDACHILLASLLHAADRVINTASVHCAFLKAIKKSAQRPLVLEVPKLSSGYCATVTCQDALDFAGMTRNLDILYLDPPYNARQYASYYHIWETLVAWDDPVLTGVAGMRPYNHQKSAWCSKKTAAAALRDTVAASDSREVWLSYSNEGILTHEQIMATLEAFGRVTLLVDRIDRFRADLDSADRHYAPQTQVEERLYILERVQDAA